MTASAAANPATNDAAAAEAAWRALHGSSDIQFAPVPPDPAPVSPEWLKAIGRFLEWLLSPVGHLLGSGWGVVETALLVGAVIGAIWIAWTLLWPLLRNRRRKSGLDVPQWIPPREEALALLEDADRLAAEGLYAEAAHLLLRRSVGQIAAARPHWLTPASTAREIGAIAELPEAARAAFSSIAGTVERARYALRPLGAEDWSVARDAYARFALAELVRG